MSSGFSPDSAQIPPPGLPLSELAKQICRLEERAPKEEAVDAGELELDFDLDQLIDESIRTEVAGVSSIGGTCMASPLASSRALDPAWSHAKADAGSRNVIICLHCGKKIGGGGITRFKYHLAGIPGQVESYKKVPNDVKRQMRQLVDDLGRNEERRHKAQHEARVGHSSRFEDSSNAIFSNEGGSASQLDHQGSKEQDTFLHKVL